MCTSGQTACNQTSPALRRFTPSTALPRCLTPPAVQTWPCRNFSLSSPENGDEGTTFWTPSKTSKWLQRSIPVSNFLKAFADWQTDCTRCVEAQRFYFEYSKDPVEGQPFWKQRIKILQNFMQSIIIMDFFSKPHTILISPKWQNR